jgi:hypothetical protein
MNKVKGILGTTDLNAATADFKNFGQFLAAVNVSNNIPGIKFADLKAAMTGTKLDGTSTGTAPVSLGQAIHKLKSDVDSDSAAATAQAQANHDAAGK